MPRAVRNATLETRSARLKLEVRREPYWQRVSKGSSIGYRRIIGGGTWIARFIEGGKKYYEACGGADDYRDADGLTVFSFAQAQIPARAFFERKANEIKGGGADQVGPYTVAEALADYFEGREHRGSKSVKADRHAAAARILPQLGQIDTARLTTKMLRSWHVALARSNKLVRSKLTAKTPATKALDANDSEAVRARRSTANRVLTIAKGALNHGFQEGRIASDEAWRKVKPFREVDTPVVRFLTAAECQRLANACEKDFRSLVRGALLTGCRYGELTRIRAGDYNREAGTVTVRLSKAGKSRHVVLNDEGRALFDALTAGRAATHLVFRRGDGAQWLASQQQRPLFEASARAKIDPPATFHILRHSYASALAQRGVPMGVIAAQLGHADTRMTEKHYAHLSPSYVADTIRAALPDFGGDEKSNVVALSP